MDQPSHPTFTRPPKSKAIPIINPGSGKRQDIAIVQKPASSLPASTDPNSKSLQAKFMLTRPTNAEIPPTSKLEKDTNIGYKQAFNIYANPFVPKAFTIINTLSGQEIDTPAVNRIDFGAYVGNYIGSQFLTPIPQLVELPMNVSFSPTDGVSDAYYEQYFRYHLQAEIQSQQQENKSYSLYGHEAIIKTHESGQPATCSFLVPGLRENSPYIEEDDIIQLRQLRYDRMGRLLGMERWLTPNCQSGESAPGFPALAGRWPAPGWTGIIYNARASSVQRKEERLLVRVSGLTAQSVKVDMQHLFSGEDHLKFNIQFPVPEERYLPMQQVLPIIQDALKPAICNRNHYQDRKGAIDVTHANISSQSPGSDNSLQLCLSDARHHWIQSMLFPTEESCEMQTKLNAGSFSRLFFDEQLNWEQRKAIDSICSQNYGTLPFLVSGPPGTGKTKTLVETALQLINGVDKVSHILFCAPSDPAADTLVQRLSEHFMPRELLRLNRASRSFAEVSGAVLPFCFIAQNKFNLPPFKRLMSYRIVVTTCRDASLLMYSRMTNLDLYAVEYGMRSSIHPYDSQPSQVELHWTALLIDEAAQAIEPEALIPLSVVAPPSGSAKLAFRPLFVMAGDEHQLRPRTSLHSSPLKISLFARLFARPVYASHPLARGNAGQSLPALSKAMLPIRRPAFANLIRNYRSHPAILAVPSALFYADTLEPHAADTDRLASWPGWRGRRWPVLYHNNSSEDELEKDGGGWYNIGEAQIACQYASLLIQASLVKEDEVCIMSPFKAQVQCLRKTIRKPQYGSLWGVDIGPTEIFQGLERGMVILCITRSKQQFLNQDKELDWGIIGVPNKMNVALTRAKFGLIVIGKRDILAQDPNWEEFLNFCERNGLVAGNINTGGRLRHGDQLELNRLEKVLLAKEQDLDVSENSRVLSGISQDDEMWTTGMQAALIQGA
jgi:hypothetical protein